jgi:hypothetical protein
MQSPMDDQRIHEERNQGQPQREQNNEGWNNGCFPWVRSKADARFVSVHRDNFEGDLDKIVASQDEWRSVSSGEVEWGSSAHAEVLADVKESKPPNSGVVIEELSDSTSTGRRGVWQESKIELPQQVEGVLPCTLGYSRQVVIKELLRDDSVVDDGPRNYCPPENWTDFVGCSQSADKREKPLGELNASLKTGDYSTSLGESSGTFSFQIQSNSIGYSHQGVGSKRGGKSSSSGDTYLEKESPGKDSIDSGMSSSPRLIILLDNSMKGHDQPSKNSSIVEVLGNLTKIAFSDGKPQASDIILPKDCVQSGESSSKNCISTSTNAEEADGLRKTAFQEDETQTSDMGLHSESVLSGAAPLTSCMSTSTNTEGTEVFGKMRKTASQEDETQTSDENLRRENVLSGMPSSNSCILTNGIDPQSKSLNDMSSQTTHILEQTSIQGCQTDDVPSKSISADETMKSDESQNDTNEDYSSDESLHADADVAILSATIDVCVTDKDKTPTLTFSDVEVWNSSFGESVCLGESKIVKEVLRGPTCALAMDEKHKGNPWRWHLGGPESDHHTARSFEETFQKDEVDSKLVTDSQVCGPLFQELNKETNYPFAGECVEVLVPVSSPEASPRGNTESMDEAKNGSSTKGHRQMKKECRNVGKSKHLKIQDLQGRLQTFMT